MNKIAIVLVIYQEKIIELPIFAVLNKILEDPLYSLIIYDNSEAPQVNPFGSKATYYHDKSNPGIARAYNYAWKLANTQQVNALLLLDDDTSVKESYLRKLTNIPLENYGAIVPQIFSGKKQISPVYADAYINRDSQFPESGIPERRIMAINSGSLIPLETLNKIDGFNEEFPLDFLDHWLFWRLHQEKLTIKILDINLQHQLSVLDYRQVSTARYQKILQAENHYYSNYDTTFLTAHKKQLIKRTLKQFVKVKNRSIWKLTFHAARSKIGEKK